MANDEVISVKDAVHKLQVYLFEGIKDENKLFAAGSLLSQTDYQDVVTERSIANMCGYPLCSNSTPSERPWKGHYRISLKEHKVYDLHETYMYCSTSCIVNSRAFAGSLQEKRSSTLNRAKLNEVLRLFEGSHMEQSVDARKIGDLGLSELKIQEKVDVKGGEISLEEWIGPSNAIEGYVPQRDRSAKTPVSKKPETGSSNKHGQAKNKRSTIFNEMDFTSCIITQDEYSISKSPAPTKGVSSKKLKKAQRKASHKVGEDELSIIRKQVDSLHLDSGDETEISRKDIILQMDNLHINEVSSTSSQHDLENNSVEAANMMDSVQKSAPKATSLKSSLKSSSNKNMDRSVTWADEEIGAIGKKIPSSSKISEDKNQTSGGSGSAEIEEDDNSYRCASAEACAVGLIQAAEAVASGSDVPDAVSEAGIIILPPPQEVDEVVLPEKDEVFDTETGPVKWPSKPGFLNYDILESEDSWYDSPPEGFSLTLSPFATTYMALFEWISSSSLAFIYGHNESSHEEYLTINGREYPRKVVLSDGRSAEIKETLAGCLSRALPGLVAELRLPTPISTMEQGLGRLLDTMSFVDPLPAFRMKQWQLIVLLLLDALSVCRIPSLTPYMTGRRTSLPKVLDGAQISAEEYEIMKDLVIPLGRVPQFSTQSGG